MVNIIERTQEERDLESKLKEFKQIAREKLREEKKEGILEVYSLSDVGLGIRDGVETPIFVHLNSHRVSVKDSKYFSLSLKLAEAYEKETKETWNLKKDYD